MTAYESAKQAVKELLGEVIELPMVFDGNSLCPECLWKAMNIMGHRWICEHCHFRCRTTVVCTIQGNHWLKLNYFKGG